MENIYLELENLLDFAQRHLLLHKRDRLLARHRLYLFLCLEGYSEGYLEECLEPDGKAGSGEISGSSFQEASPKKQDIYALTAKILRWAEECGYFKGMTEKDLFLANLLGQVSPLASQLEQHFWQLYGQSPQSATDFFYQLSQDTGYIRSDRLAQNFSWSSSNQVSKAFSGQDLIEITINLSKPEKDPKVIAAAGKKKNVGYPQCVLCPENEGYPGHLSWAPRCNHRIVELQLDGKDFALQYSPYLYYPEHSIVLSKEHKAMKIDRATFVELFDFVCQFPHYMVGSNADLPIVGGSILDHHHFQAGRYEFPMFRASAQHCSRDLAQGLASSKGIRIEILQWPLSVLKLSGEKAVALIEFGSGILEAWQNYNDEGIGVLSHSGNTPHNAITPIVRLVSGSAAETLYELYLVLRNNRSNEEHPLGIFHPHAQIHHIKKENIGLIEVMGLAILPGRLKDEMLLMQRYLESFLSGGMPDCSHPDLEQHLPWLQKLAEKLTDTKGQLDLAEFLRAQIAQVFRQGLSHCAVLPAAAAWQRFLQVLR